MKATIGNNNYGREAVAFLLDKWKQLRPRSGRLLLELGNWVALPPLFYDQKVFYIHILFTPEEYKCNQFYRKLLPL
jgi:hypothetical protein